VNKQLPSREQAILLLQQHGCSKRVIAHCLAVEKLASETATKLAAKGFQVDLQLVQAGAILHDLGRCQNHTVNHAIVGAQLAKEAGLPVEIVNIIKRHVGGGISLQEAKAFGWPEDVYKPTSLEEKIVSYADKLIGQSKRLSIEVEIKKLEADDKKEAAVRVKDLYNEITRMLDES
jgi:uncharacterized protein